MNAQNNIAEKIHQKSIAVLPFVSFSQEKENDYFADGITEEIINALTKVQGLKVIARTSSFAFKGKNIDVRIIGKELGVKAVLEGSVRRTKDRIRVTAQLIETNEGIHIFSENYDRVIGDIFELQDEISLNIADQIRENFGHFEIQDHLVQKPTSSLDSYELYLKARYNQLLWTPESLKLAIELYEQSVQLDPHFARAHYGAVQSYGLLVMWGYIAKDEGMEKAISHLMIAADIDNSLPDYPMSFAGKSFWGDWDFNEAYDRLKQTLKIDPSYTDALEAMAELHLANGYYDIAEKYTLKAIDVDPMSANHYYTLAHIKYFRRNYKEALELFEKSLRFNPEFALALELKAMCYLWLNDEPGFEMAIKKSIDPEALKQLFSLINKSDFKQDDTYLQELIADKFNANTLVPYELFILANSIYTKEAIEQIKIGVEERRGQLVNFRYDRFFESLHQFEEFKELFPKPLNLKGETELPQNGTIQKVNNQDYSDIIALINSLLESEQLFLDSDLSLRKMAEKVNLHPNRLSQIINEHYQCNFNELINQYRVDYFCKISTDHKFEHLTILGKAFESGFNSKTVFNSFFKKKMNMSPKEWLLSQ